MRRKPASLPSLPIPPRGTTMMLPPGPPTATSRFSVPPSPAPLPSPLGSTTPSSSIPTPTPRRDDVLIFREKGGVRRAENQPRCAELAGGTAAECAAVCCCFPCGVVNLLFLAMVKLPAGLCRRAIRKRRMSKRKNQKAALLARGGWRDEDYDDSLVLGARRLLAAGGGSGAVTATMVLMAAAGGGGAAVWPDTEPSKEMSEMEKEMWDRFYGTGFWRSPSQRE